MGHAGFLVEGNQSIWLIDPWLSDDGAFDGGWFQFPCNHHLSDEIARYINETSKHVYL